ncbi:MAG: hypothetical protein ACYDER_24500 [Ktedonobacteraceae bacterium]
MKNRSQTPQGGFPENNERTAHHTPYTGHIGIDSPLSHVSEDQLLLDYLLETGFAWEEAEKLLDLRDHLYDNAEMHQRMTDDYRMHFARWLYEQHEINEDQMCETDGRAL